MKRLYIFLIAIISVILISIPTPSHAIEFLTDPSEGLGYEVGGQLFFPQLHMNDAFYKDFAQLKIQYGSSDRGGLDYTMIRAEEIYDLVLFDLVGLTIGIMGEGYISGNAAAAAAGSYMDWDLWLRPKVILLHVDKSNTTVGFGLGLRFDDMYGNGNPRGPVFIFDPSFTIAQGLIDSLTAQAELGWELSTNTNKRDHFINWRMAVSYDLYRSDYIEKKIPLAINFGFLLHKDINSTGVAGDYNLNLGVFFSKFDRIQTGMDAIIGLTGNSHPDYYIGSVFGYHF
ncbi:hypothetical protein KKA47_03880 [bacterium]|nr:hypothetical protein [bacterium]